MSTKKRLFIISIAYVVFTIFLFLFLLVGASTFLTDIKIALSLVYSLFIIIFYFGMGMTTRLLSCRFYVMLISFIEAMGLLAVSICFFNVYPAADIYSLNAGDSKFLTPFKDIGITYFLYAAAVFLVAYYIVHFIIKIVDLFKVRKVCKKLERGNRPQIKINDVKILKNYNKISNKYEKYLIWRNRKGEIQSSEKLLYFDNVELIAIDSRKNIYAMIAVPQKITVKEYINLIHE